MLEKYSKTVTISLTAKDYDNVKTAAEIDRRSIAQYLSIHVEKILNNKVKETIHVR